MLSVLIDRGRTRVWLILAALVSVAIRLRMYWSPITTDEGGYLAVARSWAHGRVLYRDIWVDRPQGVLILFRFWDWISGGNTASIRIMAMLFGVLLVVSTGLVVRQLVGERAGRLAALIVAVVSAAPALEGHSANGELLSGALAATGLAVGIAALNSARSTRWMYAAGVLGGLAISLKQSGCDGLVALGGWLLFAGFRSPARRQRSRREFVALSAGTLTIIIAMAVLGATTSFTRWWFAFVGYRLSTHSALSGGEWFRLFRTGPMALIVLGGAAIASFVWCRSLVHRWRSTGVPSDSHELVLGLWLAASFVVFVAGGGFHRHYWLVLAAPLSSLAAATLARIEAAATIRLALAGMLVPSLLLSGWVFAAGRATIAVRSSDDGRAHPDEGVTRWFHHHRLPGDQLYAMCASAALYADAHTDPGYLYLWYEEVRGAPEAQDKLVSYLANPTTAPRFIAEYQRSPTCDTSGRVAHILESQYRSVGRVDGVIMLERVNPTVPRSNFRVRRCLS